MALTHAPAAAASTPARAEPQRRRSTLLALLPWTTAWGGAAAFCLIPIGFVLFSVVVEQSAEGLAALAMVFPVMLGGAVALWFYGLVAGLLAGLPDWLLRRRPRLRPIGAALAVVILTVLVAAPWVVANSRVLDLPLTAPTTLTSTAIIAGATALATLVVVLLHGRRQRRLERDSTGQKMSLEQP
ncbi:hypothetical protein FRIG_07235 [Frigoribacterium faeni]|uniref:hypothetical protein n=1 Tax=Frigoribacterium faeni TaxID=145483 RepID=UPI001FABF9C7|nr:hypothetical protein [Frigoribacterium faeni]MCJ0700924.1 hypothetical protein [Frigoribacterium faeni]